MARITVIIGHDADTKVNYERSLEDIQRAFSHFSGEENQIRVVHWDENGGLGEPTEFGSYTDLNQGGLPLTPSSNTDIFVINGHGAPGDPEISGTPDSDGISARRLARGIESFSGNVAGAAESEGQTVRVLINSCHPADRSLRDDQCLSSDSEYEDSIAGGVVDTQAKAGVLERIVVRVNQLLRAPGSSLSRSDIAIEGSTGGVTQYGAVVSKTQIEGGLRGVCRPEPTLRDPAVKYDTPSGWTRTFPNDGVMDGQSVQTIRDDYVSVPHESARIRYEYRRADYSTETESSFSTSLSSTDGSTDELSNSDTSSIFSSDSESPGLRTPGAKYARSFDNGSNPPPASKRATEPVRATSTDTDSQPTFAENGVSQLSNFNGGSINTVTNRMLSDPVEGLANEASIAEPSGILTEPENAASLNSLSTDGPLSSMETGGAAAAEEEAAAAVFA